MKRKLKRKNKNYKIGISLIVLVITIIVIVILAVAVILSIANNNPIENANKAVFFNDMSALNDELALYLTNQVGNDSIKNVSASGKDLKGILPSIKDKYLDKLEIINGKLTYTSDENLQELNWAKEYFEGVKANFEKIDVESGSTIDIESAKETKVENIKIYGNSIQSGTPSLESPIEVESVGELVTDESDTNYGKYRIPITVSGKNMFDITSAELTGDCQIIDNSIQFSEGTGAHCDILLPAGKYTMSFKSSGGNLFLRDGKVTNGYIAQIRDEDDKVTFDYTANVDGYLRITSFENVKLSSIQIEAGDVATGYEAYSGKTYNIYLNEPLRKIGNVSDYIDLKKGKVIRNVKKYTITNLVNYTYIRNDIGWNDGFLRTCFYIPNRLSGNENVKTNKLLGISNYNVLSNGFRNLDAHFEIQLDLDLFGGEVSNTREELYELANQYLINNSIEVIYATSEVKTEDITNLSDIFTKYGQNIVRIETKVTPSKVEIIYDKNV